MQVNDKMKWFLSAQGVTLTVALITLGGCGGSQSPGLPAASAQSQERGQARPRILPGKDTALIYAAGACGGACVLSYPEGTAVARLAITGAVGGDCSDSSGDVFITNGSQVLEYGHGGSNPIATLELPGSEAAACSVDPVTGNLAVVFSGSDADIAIFPDAKGTPELYQTHIVSLFCGYDGSGDLFVSGYDNLQSQLAELPYGVADFSDLSISGNVGAPGQVQWDGTYITYEGRSTGDVKVSRLRISGSTATVVSTTRVRGALRYVTQSWIYGDRILIPYAVQGQQSNKISLWAYPKGGEPVTRFGNFGQTKFAEFTGVTLSV